VAPLLPGYIHPDEFFQGGQELWFGCPPYRTWEFQSENALRSVVPPTIMTWLPLHLFAKIRGVGLDDLSGWYVWIVPRVACAILSIIAVDGSIWALSQTTNSKMDTGKSQGVPIPVLMVASAWPTMALLIRPFSNAMETWILALLFRAVLFEQRDKKSSQAKVTIFQCLTIGVLSALGIFTRFTFIFFAFPIILYLGFRMVSELQMWDRLVKAVITCFAFVVVVMDIMERDTRFYDSSAPVLTPWNMMSYNSRVENLQEHGIHPRWTHALVNMFLLYGPMTLMVYLSLLWTTSLTSGTSKEVTGPDQSARSRTTTYLSKWIILVGLGALSLAPHQEPRFLLPLIVPLSLLSDDPRLHGRHRRWIVYLWVAFNASMLIFFGVLHQSGVVPSLIAFGSVPALLQRSPSALAFYHVYMPPTFLSRTAFGCRNIPFVDLNGSRDIASLRETLSTILLCDNEHSRSDSYLHLVSSPLLEYLDENLWLLGDRSCVIPGFACESIWEFGAHLSLENLPTMTELLRARLPLAIYEISCKNI
jgi:GPI mannosyltransferase 4